MYWITKLNNGKYLCEVRIQDGTERWTEESEDEAVHSVIQGARVLNGSYIRRDDISIWNEPPKQPNTVSDEDMKLLSEIRRGAKKVLDFDHYLLKYRITQ